MAKTVALVAMTALSFATLVGPSGNILHTDPDGLDPQAREPEVTEADADFLEENGVAERKTPKAKAKEDTGSETKAKPAASKAPAKGAKTGKAVTPAKTPPADPPADDPVDPPVGDGSGVADDDPDVPQ